MDNNNKNNYDVFFEICKILAMAIFFVISYNVSENVNNRQIELNSLQQKEIVVKTLDNENPKQRCMGIELCSKIDDVEFCRSVYNLFSFDTDTAVVQLSLSHLEKLNNSHPSEVRFPTKKDDLSAFRHYGLQLQADLSFKINNDKDLLALTHKATMNNDSSAKLSLLKNPKLFDSSFISSISTTDSGEINREFDNKFSLFRLRNESAIPQIRTTLDIQPNFNGGNPTFDSDGKMPHSDR